MTHSFILKFGKYKGINFNETPVSYQNWLLSQDWFKVPVQPNKDQQASKRISTLSKQLNGWDGFSSRGSAIYESIFDAECQLADEYENSVKYAGLTEQEKQIQMISDYDEIAANNIVYDYYND